MAALASSPRLGVRDIAPRASSCPPPLGAVAPPRRVVTVVGRGRVGSALGRMAEATAQDVRFVLRSDGAEAFANASGPIYVATHASDVDAVLAKIPEARLPEVVLLQGGLLRAPWLARRGLASATQCCLYLSASADGAVVPPPPDVPTVLSDGPCASHAADLLAAANVATVLCGDRGGGRASSAAFARVSLEKLLWTSIFWMLCAASGPGVAVGDVVDSEPELVRALAAELTDVIATAAPTHRAEFERGCLDAASRAETEAGLLRYSRAIRDAVPSAEMATREAAFRNGWFVRVGGEKAQPLHAEWLRRAGVDVEALARVSIE